MAPARLFAAAFAAVVLAFAAAGCGGGSGGGKSYPGAQPDVWLPTVCGALADWLHGLDASSARMRADLEGGRDTGTVKARFIVWLKEVEDVSGASLAKVKAVGPPAVEAGPAFQHDFEARLAQVQASFTHAIERTKRLSTDDAEAFKRGLKSISNDMAQELGAVDFDELNEKYEDETSSKEASKYPACEELEAASS